VAVLFVGLAVTDVMNRLVDEVFSRMIRQDATVTLTQPRGARALHAIARLPGVLEVEPMRSIPVRLRAGTHSRTLGITGLPERPRLRQVIDSEKGVLTLPADGLLLSRALGDVLDVRVGDRLQVEVLEGRRPVEQVAIAGFVDDRLGLQAYMHIDRVHRLLREGDTLTAVAVRIDRASQGEFYDAVKGVPLVASVSLRDATVKNFQKMIAENMNLQIFINVLFAGIIAFGVIYNAARVSLSERSRELASLRVLGFTRAEISLILLGELATLTILALPLGVVIGDGLGELIVGALSSEMYRMPFAVMPATIAWAWLATIAATILSALVVRRRLDHLDMIAVLKTAE
jgi:putative ABC transport system permease protein